MKTKETKYFIIFAIVINCISGNALAFQCKSSDYSGRNSIEVTFTTNADGQIGGDFTFDDKVNSKDFTKFNFGEILMTTISNSSDLPISNTLPDYIKSHMTTAYIYKHKITLTNLSWIDVYEKSNKIYSALYHMGSYFQCQ